MYPIISLNVCPEGWDKNLMIEVELPEQLSAKYLHQGRTHKIQVETIDILKAIAATGVNIGNTSDVLYVYQKNN